MPRQYNRQVRVELESVRDGYTSLQCWNHTVTRPNEVIPDPEPANLLLAAMTPGTATCGSLTVGIDAGGIITLDGTSSTRAGWKSIPRVRRRGTATRRSLPALGR